MAASSSAQSLGNGDADVIVTDPGGEEKKDPSYYYPLYKAALSGDWTSAEIFINRNPDSIKQVITKNGETALQIAATTGKSLYFVKKLVERMSKEALALPDNNGDTALNLCAVVGDIQVASIMVKKNPTVPHIKNNRGNFPIHKAAQNAQKDMVLYLLEVTREDVEPSPIAGKSGALLLINVITSGFLDVALDLVQRYPHMATVKLDNGRSALQAIAKKASAFRSGCDLNVWQRFIYSCVQLKLEDHPIKSMRYDIENPVDNAQMQMSYSFRLPNGKHSLSVCQRMHAMLLKCLESFVPFIKHIREKKLMHHQAIQLVKSLCKQIESLNNSEAYSSHYITPVLLAARLGIPEVVEEIVEAFPSAVWCYNKDKHRVFQVAVLNRCEKVFNLSYQMSGYKWCIAQNVDDKGSNILHLAGRLAPLHKLRLVSGAALQMQREIQWFKEVEKFVRPHYREMENNDKETPSMVFTRDHKDLVVEGEKWMKDTANSCTIAAALIATVVFAAAITVPGGNNGNNGFPLFLNRRVFLVFFFSDAISLFTSSTSVLMFLSILTSRYSEQDFLFVLPKRLVFGLLTLFVSITAMMIAFSTAIYLVFGHRRAWIFVPIAALACLPVTSFVTLQFPLLFDVVSSTYGRGIFGKQSDRPYY